MASGKPQRHMLSTKMIAVNQTSAMTTEVAPCLGGVDAVVMMYVVKTEAAIESACMMARVGLSGGRWCWMATDVFR